MTHQPRRSWTGSSVAYFDSSAIVKLVLDEPESRAIREALTGWPRRATSKLTIVEVLRAVRLRRESAEALHLATALALGERLDAFVSYDARQLRAAADLGLPVVSPR